MNKKDKKPLLHQLLLAKIEELSKNVASSRDDEKQMIILVNMLKQCTLSYEHTVKTTNALMVTATCLRGDSDEASAKSFLLISAGKLLLSSRVDKKDKRPLLHQLVLDKINELSKNVASSYIDEKQMKMFINMLKQCALSPTHTKETAEALKTTATCLRSGSGEIIAKSFLLKAAGELSSSLKADKKKK